MRGSGSRLAAMGPTLGTKFSKKAMTPNVKAMGTPKRCKASPNMNPVKTEMTVFSVR